MPVISLAMAYGLLPLESEPPRVQSALKDDIWARRNYAVFNAMLEHVITNRPALVLVAEDPADRHIDYVTNDPALDGEILRGRFRPELRPLDEIITCFPDRAIYVVALVPDIVSKIDRGEYDAVRFEYLAEEPLVNRSAVIYHMFPASAESP